MALALFTVLLMPLSAFINFEYYQARQTAFDSQYAEGTNSENQEAYMRAYRAPALLSTLARGSEPYMPVFYEFENPANSYNTDEISPGNIEAQDFSTLSTFGSFDFLFLVQAVFSLLAFLLAFDMIAGEKERGTLRAVLANQVPRDAILLGKYLGGFALLWVIFLVGFLILVLVLGVLNAQFLSAGMLLRMGILLGISTLFLAGFFGLGLMVSTFCYSTRTAIVVLLVLWVFLQLVIPKAGEMVGTAFRPVKSEHLYRVERARILDELRVEMEEDAGKVYKDIFGENELLRSSLLTSGTPEAERFFQLYQANQQDIKRRMRDQLNGIRMEWEREKEAQRALARGISIFSPAASLTLFLTDLAETGDLAYQTYRNAVSDQALIIDREVYVRQASTVYRIRTEGMMMSGSIDPPEGTPEPNVPTFLMPAIDLSETIRYNLWPLVSLLLYLIIPFAVAYLRFLRYDVR